MKNRYRIFLTRGISGSARCRLLCNTRFLVYEIVELYRQWQTGRGIRAIARSLGIDRKTIRKYLDAAAQAGLSPGQERSVEEWTAFVRDQFPRLVDARQRSRRATELDRYQDFIREGMKQNRMSTVHRRLVERTSRRGDVPAVCACHSLFSDPVLAEGALDRLVSASHHVLIEGPSYGPRKRLGVAITAEAGGDVMSRG